MYHPHGYTAALTQSIHASLQTGGSRPPHGCGNGYGHADHPVNQKCDIQGMNRYFGWYERKIQDIKPWIERKNGKKRISLATPDADTEYGADANIEHQTEILGDALN